MQKGPDDRSSGPFSIQRLAPPEMVAIDLDDPAVALVDEQQVVIVADIGQVATGARHAPAAVPGRAIARRVIVGAQRRTDAELMIAERGAIILVTRVAAPVADFVAIVALGVAIFAAFLANVTAIAITLCIAQLAPFFANVTTLFANLARLCLRRHRDHHRGDKAGGEKFHPLHCAIPLHRQGGGDLPDDWEWITRVDLNCSGTERLFSGH